MLQLVLSIAPLIYVTLFFILKKQKINNWVNLLFYGGLTVIVALLMLEGLNFILPVSSSVMINSSSSLIIKFFGFLIFAGFVEEISKYLALKCTKPRTKTEVLINIIYIALIFDAYENYLYIGTYNSLNLGFLRAFVPGHFLFAIIMGAFLMKALEYREQGDKSSAFGYEILGLVSVMFAHALFDLAVTPSLYNLLPKMVSRGIYIFVSLILPFCWLFKFFKSNNEIENEKTRFKVVKIIFIILFSVCVLYVGDIETNTGKLNKPMIVEGVEVTVVSVNEVNEEKYGILDDEKEDFVKVNLKIKNTQKETLNGSRISFYLTDMNNKNNNVSCFFIKSDMINELAYNEEQELNLYFSGKLNENYQFTVGILDKNSNKTFYYFQIN